MFHHRILPFALLATAATAQQWVPVATFPRYRATHGMATDPLTGRPLIFGGTAVYNWFATQSADADTWRWNGSAWYRCAVTNSPAAQDASVMATDLVRHRTVLFASSATPPATWEWDGRDWTQRSPAASPPAGFVLNAAMAFDVSRARTVLFDGAAGQTWEWDGTNWLQVTTAQVPPFRLGCRLAYDLVRARTVLFGGDDGSRQHRVFNDTWEYDGTAWTQIATAGMPPGRSEHAMCYDLLQQRVLLYGGRVGAALLNDTWSYDGLTWTQNTTAQPPLQVDPAMTGDVDGHTILFTAHDTGSGAVPETWDWNGSTWTQLATPASPPVREMHALATDATGQLLLFGGYNAAFSGLGGQAFADTWRFDGMDWQLSAPAAAPSPRAFCQLAKDTGRGRVVLFGGEGNNVWSGETWEWDGTNWLQRAVAGPAPRSRGAMVYDAVRGNCVLHGGTDGTSFFGDTWLWNGTQWQQVPGSGPGPRTDHAMAWDSGRGLTFLFGGQLNGTTQQNDLWRWDGANWTQLAASTPPAPRGFHDFTYDPDRARFVLHGSDTVNDTWEWDGLSTWTQIVSGDRAPTATATGATWDAERHRIVLWDGDALWAYTPSAAGSASYGAGCGTVVPELIADGRPFLGSRAFGFEVAHAPAGGLVGLCVSFGAASTPLPPGCTVLLQSPITVAFAVASASGLEHFPLQVPAVAALKGLTFFAQAGALSTTSGIALTQGVRSVLGD